MASLLFSERLPEHLGLHLGFGVHALESAVFLLKLLHPSHEGGVHAAVFRPPLVERGAAHAVFAAKFRHGNAVFGLLQDAQDLAVGVAGRLHVKSPRPGLRENSTFQNNLFSGGLPWPGVPVYHNVRDIHGQNVKPVDIVIGGFPCQDISCAGKGAGITGERSGLWSEYARILRELRPRYAVVENVKALLGRGLDRVLGDLAEIGYDAEWDVFPAAAFGAPHLRERVILVAYPGGDRGPACAPILAPGGNLAIHRQPDGPVDWNGLRLTGPRSQAAVSAYNGPVVCRVDDGGAPWLDRLRCLGNGITPAVLRWVLDQIVIR